MSTPSKKQYSHEYKLEVLELLRSSGKSKAQLERDLACIRVNSKPGSGR